MVTTPLNIFLLLNLNFVKSTIEYIFFFIHHAFKISKKLNIKDQ